MFKLSFKIVITEAVLASALWVGVYHVAHAQSDFDKKVSAMQKQVDAEVLKTPMGAYMNLVDTFAKFELLTDGIPKGQTADQTGIADANLAQARLEKEVADYINQGLTCKEIKDRENTENNGILSKLISEKTKNTPVIIKAKNKLVDALSLYSVVTCKELTE